MQIINLMAAKSSKDNPKKWLPFVAHSSDTAGIMGMLFENISEHLRCFIAAELSIGCEFDYDEGIRLAKNTCLLAAYLHDIGKLTPAFQRKIIDNIEGYRSLLEINGLRFNHLSGFAASPHNVAGLAILKDAGFSEEFSCIIGSHHGRCVGDSDQLYRFPENYYGVSSFEKDIWEGIRKEWIEYSLNECNFHSPQNVPVPNVKVQMLITAMLIMCDWISSNTDYFPLADAFSVPDGEERVKNGWASIGMPACWSVEYLLDPDDMYREFFNYSPYSFQSEIMSIVNDVNCAGVYIIEAPMGLGKTEAALATAEVLAYKFGLGGLFFGLPTQATANGLFGRIQGWAEKQSDGERHTIRLAHGSTELNSDYRSVFRGTANDISDEGGVFVHEWFEGRKRELLSDFVVATVDQFLLSSLKQKHVMLRHLGLAGKAVIIDECHAYDAYMNVYLDRTLAWMGAYKIPVIILSATLPPSRRSALIKAYLNKKNEPDIPRVGYSYPLLTWTDGEEVFSRPLTGNGTTKNIKVQRISEEDIVPNIVDKLSNGGCAAVIVNTVAKAQKISRLLSSLSENLKVICFHSRYTASDRADKESEILRHVGKDSKPEMRNNLVIVGTQVIEQSLDIDFDYMISELCPMDLLLQRSGRLHRHARKRPAGLQNPVLSVIMSDDDSSEHIYSKWILNQTDYYLPETLEIPSCIPELINKVYDESTHLEIKEWNEHVRTLKDKETAAEKYCINAGLLKKKRYNTLNYFLDDDVGNSEDAEASVRDSERGIEVLLMMAKESGKYSFMPWRNEGMAFDITSTIIDSEALLIANERIRIPAYYSRQWKKTLEDLNAIPMLWRDHGCLKRELLLIVDGDLTVSIGGKKLCYSREYGLEEVKEGR